MKAALMATVLAAGVLGAGSAAAQSRVVDVLLDQQDVSVEGSSVGAFLTDTDGLAVGDVNGDGAADLAFGQSGPALVGVLLGPLAGGTRLDLAASSADITLGDSRWRSFFGRMVLVADVSGDGIGDLVVGADRDERAVGEVDVFFGPLTRGTVLPEAPLVADAVLMGLAVTDWTGRVLRAGDFDGDGFEDLLIAAPGAHGPGDVAINRIGEAYVVFGPITRGVRELATTPPDVTIYGPLRGGGSVLGRLMAAGDVTGDGIDDIVLSAQAETTSTVPATAGAVHVIFGRARAAWSPVIDLELEDSDFTIRCTRGMPTGSTVQVGDVSGDGIGDLVVAMQATDLPGRRTAGNVRVFSGPLAPGTLIDPVPDAVILGADSTDYTGDALQVGDLSGDGVPDLVIGTRHGDGPGNRDRSATVDVSTGEAAVLIGPIARGDVIDLATDIDLLVTGRGGDDALGHVLALGDLSGDGVADLAVGTIWSDGFDTVRPSAGEAHVVFSMLAGACRRHMAEVGNVLVAKSAGGGFTLRLERPPLPGDLPENVYAGSIASLHAGVYDHHALADGCGIVDGVAELADDGVPATYWLIVAACRDDLGPHEGPLGNAVAGSVLTPRPSAAALGLSACP